MEEVPIPTEYVSYALASGTTRSEMLRNASVKIGCTKMVEALAAYHKDSTQPLATIKRFGVSKSSFYLLSCYQVGEGKCRNKMGLRGNTLPG